MIKFFPQHDKKDCAPACLRMIARSYGLHYSLEYLREKCYLTKDGVSILNISLAATEIGFQSTVAKTTIDIIETDCTLPAILHWNQEHFVVLYKIKNGKFFIADPAHGIIKLNKNKFIQSWVSTEDNKGTVLLISPTENTYKQTSPNEKKINIKHIFSYLIPYKKQLILMFFLLLIGSVLTLIFPFLTQKLIDEGVNSKNINFISIVLLAQLALFTGTVLISIFRNWIMLYVGTHLSINIISDFLKKLLQLPISFFDTKVMGDFNQRIQDNDRIEEFLTSHSLTTFFSLITFLVFFGVLWHYDFGIMIVYILLTIVALSWSFYWLKKRKNLDYFRFQQRSENQESIYEIINGVSEMKLNQFEDFKRSKWEEIQQRLYKINIRILKIDQLQLSGYEFLSQVKNILVTFLAAILVVKSFMTLGELLAISYIIGQLNSPINQLVGFFRSLQDAKLSLGRLAEVQNEVPEEQPNIQSLLSNHNEISIENLSFQYEGPKSPFILKDINITIAKGKVTAIVGASGSGKTTLLKLLLKFYKPISGHIFYGEDDISNLSPQSLRKQCGVVMQDGFIFSDTIERNIATGDENINKERIYDAAKIANIEEFINNLPLGYNTKIGASGNGVSGGQKQRVLIARAVYKNPHYIFFDEATSALDAENEKIIHENLQTFFKGKTVLIIAHRLSTVKNADQIIVLDKGKIVETGTHEELTNKRGKYFELVKNQLELGD